MSLELISHSPEQTQYIGVKLGELAQAGDVFLLTGKLGSGKTCLAQGIAWGLEVKDYASSPSFVLVKEHQGRLPLYHIDLYRLNRVEEIQEVGLDDYFYGKGICVVEWAEKGGIALPSEHLLINLEFVSATERRLTFEAKGARYQELVSELLPRLD